MKTVNAYVRIDTNSGYITPTSSSTIKNVSGTWANGVNGLSNDEWLWGISQYFGASGLNGNYLNVGADFYVGIESVMSNGTINLPNSYLYNARNTLKSSNLRCGIGSTYKSGYDATYSPVITNFNVTYSTDLSPSQNNHDLYHITFNYSQQLSSIVNINSTNITCWFERNPSDGLFMQSIGSYTLKRYTYYNNSFNYSVSTDPNTGLLQDITNQNETIINQNNTTNQKLDDLKDADYNGATEQPNTDNYEDYEENEQALLDNMSSMNLNDVSIAIDNNSSGFVWNTLTRFIQSNSLIFSMIISILSIGIIKLMLSR